jgi:hexosaminidase
MRNVVRVLLFAILFAFSSCQHNTNKEVAIIPLPQSIDVGNSSFVFTEDIEIAAAKEDDLEEQLNYFVRLIGQYAAVNITDVSLEKLESKKSIILKLNNDKRDENDESYSLNIDDNSIVILANSKRGVFYGIQSVFQLILLNNRTSKAVSIPTLSINDNPRFKYRGIHLDVGRHMFPPSFIKKYIDIMALYKINTFHWHLTEDQGWRIEIKKYPKLTEIGSIRKETLIGHGDRDSSEFTYDGKPYGGFYSQDEIRDIVAYAAERQITIIPEIEMPGHSLAALAAYPELGCTGGPYEVATRWGVFEDIYCTKDSTFEFLQNVLLEVMDLFPSEYIHIGGDEAPKSMWKKCEVCQDTIEREGLKNEHELQSYFIQRIEKFLNKHGRNIIGWDEILEGGLAPNATVMSWRGTEGGIEAARQGHDVIMSPGETCYFDHYQSKNKNEPLAIGGYLPLENVYNYEPVPEELSVEEAKHILGAQANVWTEYMPDSKHVEYMILPRMAALAELNWTDKEKKNLIGFQSRIIKHFEIYDILGYNYCNH